MQFFDVGGATTGDDIGAAGKAVRIYGILITNAAAAPAAIRVGIRPQGAGSDTFTVGSPGTVVNETEWFRFDPAIPFPAGAELGSKTLTAGTATIFWDAA